MKQSTQGQFSETTQRDGMEREVGGEFKNGKTHVHPWVIHVNVWKKKTHQYCKDIILQLKEIN